jgi:isoquinoline 1-oxidoreductase beta subunit
MTPTMAPPVRQDVSRRTFIIGSGAAAIAVSFAAEAFAQQIDGARPNAWVVIGADGGVTLFSPATEMGQGSMTALPLLIAEDLDVDWKRVRVVQAPSEPKIYGNPAFYGAMTTVGSMAMAGYYEKLRLAGAQARRVLILTASNRWNVPVAELTTTPGAVVHAASGRRIGYGELAADMVVPNPLPEVKREELKPLAQCRYIGKDVPRVDVPGKVDGSAVYGSDIMVPGMIYATVLHPPVQGETPLKIDDLAARGIKGVIDVVALPNAVAVLASTIGPALKAKRLLRVDWSVTAPGRTYSDRAVEDALLRVVRDGNAGAVRMVEEGDAAAGIAGAAKVFAAEYVTGMVAHACMEPMSAIAKVTPGKVEIWASNQSPSYMKQYAVDICGVTDEQVVVHTPLAGGGFGRRTDGDEVMEALHLAKARPGTAIKVIWSREDDIQNDKYRPLAAQRIEVGLDAGGQIVGWRHRMASEGYMVRGDPKMLAILKGKDPVSAGGGQFSYAVPSHLMEWTRVPRGVAAGAWRSTSNAYVKFAIEGMIDEIAASRGVDPVEYRLSLLQRDPRAQAVVREVAAMADWSRPRPAGRALGFAYSDSCARTAVAAEVSLDRATGAITIHHLWAASDPGVVVQPANAAAQLEGAMTQAVGAFIHEEITVKDGVVQQANFNSYRPLRMSQVPPMTVKVISTDNKPGGMGEAGVPPTGAAIANAIARLTGKRVRRLPMSPANVLAALKA